jgi:hypothetical protein
MRRIFIIKHEINYFLFQASTIFYTCDFYTSPIVFYIIYLEKFGVIIVIYFM